MTGCRLSLEQGQQSKIGFRSGTNNRLGEDFTLGTSAYVDQCRFTLTFFDLDYKSYRQFLPSGSEHQALVNQVKLHLGSELMFDIELKIPGKRLPQPKLKQKNPLRLGWNFVLKSNPKKPSKRVITTRIKGDWINKMKNIKYKI